jgi:acetylglutamate kinase
MVSDELQRAFAEDIVYLRYVGHQARRRARRRPADLVDARRGWASERVPGGYRVTTPEAMDVVRMVLTGR